VTTIGDRDNRLFFSDPGDLRIHISVATAQTFPLNALAIARTIFALVVDPGVHRLLYIRRGIHAVSLISILLVLCDNLVFGISRRALGVGPQQNRGLIPARRDRLISPAQTFGGNNALVQFAFCTTAVPSDLHVSFANRGR
jgi:hypothetical protein